MLITLDTLDCHLNIQRLSSLGHTLGPELVEFLSLLSSCGKELHRLIMNYICFYQFWNLIGHRSPPSPSHPYVTDLDQNPTMTKLKLTKCFSAEDSLYM